MGFVEYARSDENLIAHPPNSVALGATRSEHGSGKQRRERGGTLLLSVPAAVIERRSSSFAFD
jgi:hypothetical protein